MILPPFRRLQAISQGHEANSREADPGPRLFRGRRKRAGYDVSAQSEGGQGAMVAITRRALLARVSSLAATAVLGGLEPRLRAARRELQASATGAGPRSISGLTARDDAFLDDFSRRAFRFFCEHQNPQTGLVLDRARTDGAEDTSTGPPAASIAATGFGLTAYCIGAERGWADEAELRGRVRAALCFFAQHAAHEHGWFYHFLEPATGRRMWACELSSIDTALLLAGILTARQRFHDDAEIVRLATAIYERVDFHWMLNGDRHLLSMGWKPESGFLSGRWDSYSELMVIYALAIGSPKHAIPAEAWYAWKRPLMTYDGYAYVGCTCATLFTQQYSQAWLDFRHRRERRGSHLDWFRNSEAATRAHRAFCLSLVKRFPGYSANVWGVTPSDSARGYVAWGGPPFDSRIDGTVVPCAAGGSLMFAPDICLPALRAMRDNFGGRIFGRYGFADAFNPSTGWVDPDVIGIDVGITMLSAENLRSGEVWNWFMKNPEMDRVMNVEFERA